jgi:hypothetical protein
MTFLGLVAMTGCKKEESESGGNNTPSTPTPNPPTTVQNNTFKITKPDGTELAVTMTSVSIFTDNGTFTFVGLFNVGAQSGYDRVAVGFRTPPANGEYSIMNGTSVSLPEGKAQHNTTYDGINYVTNTDNNATVTISTVSVKKKVSFTNLPLNQGGTAVAGGTLLPEGCKITGVMVEP